MGRNRLLLVVLPLGVVGALLGACNSSVPPQAAAGPTTDLPPGPAGAPPSNQTAQGAGETATALPVSAPPTPNATGPVVAPGQAVPFVGHPSVGAALRAAKANANAQ